MQHTELARFANCLTDGQLPRHRHRHGGGFAFPDVVNYAAYSHSLRQFHYFSLAIGGSLVRAGVTQLLTLTPAKGASPPVIKLRTPLATKRSCFMG